MCSWVNKKKKINNCALLVMTKTKSKICDGNGAIAEHRDEDCDKYSNRIVSGVQDTGTMRLGAMGLLYNVCPHMSGPEWTWASNIWTQRNEFVCHPPTKIAPYIWYTMCNTLERITIVACDHYRHHHHRSSSSLSLFIHTFLQNRRYFSTLYCTSIVMRQCGFMNIIYTTS